MKNVNVRPIAKRGYLFFPGGCGIYRERSGAALIVALIILLLFALIGSTIMMLSVNDDRMINDRLSNINALAAAEAGIAEAIRRLSLPPSDSFAISDPGVPPAAGWRTYILLSGELPPTEPPVYCEMSVQMLMPESLRIPYSTAQLDVSRSLMIAYKTDVKEGDNIIYYNWDEEVEESHNPGNYRGKYFPVAIIEATGSAAKVERTLQVEVARRGLAPSVDAALSCNTDIEIAGKFTCCGHDHLFDTPWGTNAGSDRFECFDEPGTDDAAWHSDRSDGKPHGISAPFEKPDPDRWCGEAGCIPGVSACGNDVRTGTQVIVRGNPDRSGDVSGKPFQYLYQMLNTESWEELENQFMWQVLEPGTIDGGSYVGFYKCDGDLDIRGVVNVTGVLWVTGDLKQRGHLSANGIVYTERSLVCDGNVWILGAVAIEGRGASLVRPFNGKGILLYSLEGIERALAAADGYRIVARREK